MATPFVRSSGISRPDRCSRGGHRARRALHALVARSKAVHLQRGRPPKLLVAKPGLDVTPTAPNRSRSPLATRDSKSSIRESTLPERSPPPRATRTSTSWVVNPVGLASGPRVRILECLRDSELDIKVVVGGIVPTGDARSLLDMGVVAVYTPRTSPRRHHGRPLGNRRIA